MDIPDTVTDALALLRAEGYTDDFNLTATGLSCSRDAAISPLEDAVVEHTFRFEGDSNPDDEAIVLGISSGGRKGVLVSAYGPTTDPDEVAMLTRLTTANRGP